MSKTEVTDRS